MQSKNVLLETERFRKNVLTLLVNAQILATSFISGLVPTNYLHLKNVICLNKTNRLIKFLINFQIDDNHY